MRSSAINVAGINAEPMNGQGVYPVVKTLSAAWEVFSRVPVRTLPVSYNINVGNTVIAAVAPTWDVRHFVQAVRAASWNASQFAASAQALAWNVCQYVSRSSRIGWRVPFQRARQTSPLTGQANTGRLIRHTATSPINRG